VTPTVTNGALIARTSGVKTQAPAGSTNDREPFMFSQ
jgi:hypothetical protein